MKKKLVVIFLILLTLGLQACNANPENIYTFEIDSAYTEYLIMGTSADYPPYEWPMEVNGKKTLVGIDIELGKRIAKAENKNLKVINKGFDFLLTDLQDGTVDFVLAGMNPTPEREAIVSFSDVYYEASHSIVVHSDNASKYSNLENLNKGSIKVGAQLGSVQQELADSELPNTMKQYLQSVADLFMQLNDKSVDAIIVENPVAVSYLKSFKNLTIQDIQIGDPEDGSAVAVRKGETLLLETINDVIKELQDSGKMNEIIADAISLESSKSGGFSFLLDKEYVTTLLKGLLMTLVLAVLSVVLGSVIAFGVAIMRLSNNKIISNVSKSYVEIIRGTPLLVQVLLIYSIVKISITTFLGIDLSTFIPGMLALLINSSAYVSEIIRGGILSVDKGQKEAAQSLGMNKYQVMRKIIMPQAVKNIIPSLGNEFVTMIKETSIFMYLGVAELMYSAQLVKTGTYAIKEVYITVAVLYLVLTLSTSKLMAVIERRLRKHDEK